eukprot:TRINITY_DN125_c0_g4_i1.p1 TRINITY_DN125_c0_g4~~TRINITY_DN125_c0_g4_i1.p1  ORF type:complete len:309 (+),score=81.60 TRINITY_DN125_c0_g4_i1:65-928(+)
MARSGTTAMPDPHNVSHTLDEAGTQRLVDRLEARGRDEVFQSTFRPWLHRLVGRSRVLEVGCGTGVISRAIAATEGFNGYVVGVDQSPGLLEAAGSIEGSASSSGLRYLRASAETLRGDLAAAGEEQAFDAIVMHTLLSHVSAPLDVLRAAREVAAPGALLVITDGDYSGLSYAHEEDEELGRAMDAALISATFAQPRVMRRLPGMLQQGGWQLESHTARCVADVGRQASYWVSFAEAYLPRVRSAGLIGEEAADGWWAAQQRAIREGRFFATCSYLTYFASPAGDD